MCDILLIRLMALIQSFASFVIRYRNQKKKKRKKIFLVRVYKLWLNNHLIDLSERNDTKALLVMYFSLCYSIFFLYYFVLSFVFFTHLICFNCHFLVVHVLTFVSTVSSEIARKPKTQIENEEHKQTRKKNNEFFITEEQKKEGKKQAKKHLVYFIFSLSLWFSMSKQQLIIHCTFFEDFRT